MIFWNLKQYLDWIKYNFNLYDREDVTGPYRIDSILLDQFEIRFRITHAVIRIHWFGIKIDEERVIFKSLQTPDQLIERIRGEIKDLFDKEASNLTDYQRQLEELRKIIS